MRLKALVWFPRVALKYRVASLQISGPQMGIRLVEKGTSTFVAAVYIVEHWPKTACNVGIAFQHLFSLWCSHCRMRFSAEDDAETLATAASLWRKYNTQDYRYSGNAWKWKHLGSLVMLLGYCYCRLRWFYQHGKRYQGRPNCTHRRTLCCEQHERWTQSKFKSLLKWQRSDTFHQRSASLCLTRLLLTTPTQGSKLLCQQRFQVSRMHKGDSAM